MTKVKGDLLARARDGRYDAIAHGCNSFCRMEAGIAKQVKEQFPQAYRADQMTIPKMGEKLGKYSLAFISEGDFTLINAYTQYDCKGDNNVDYEAIRNVFSLINRDFPGRFIGIPAIGAGLAGGDWDRISRIINRVTPDIHIELVEYDG